MDELTEAMTAAAQKRARWRGYFAQHVTGSDAEIDAATEAAMRALEAGADAQAIIAAGMAGAQAFRTRPATRQQPPPVNRPPVSTARPAFQVIGSKSSGIVNGLQQRQEMFGRTYFTVWNFRLERTDATGVATTPIPVEMRGRRFQGAVNNGDLVDLGHRVKAGELVRPRRVRNLTTGTEVKSFGRRHPVLRVFIFLILLLIFASWVSFVVHLGTGN